MNGGDRVKPLSATGCGRSFAAAWVRLRKPKNSDTTRKSEPHQILAGDLRIHCRACPNLATRSSYFPERYSNHAKWFQISLQLYQQFKKRSPCPGAGKMRSWATKGYRPFWRDLLRAG